MGNSLVGTLLKKKAQPDRDSLKRIIDSIRAGHSIGIFPEGDRSWDGETAPLIAGTGSLVKKVSTPIMIGRFSGNYLTLPRWAEQERSGKIFLDMYSLSAEEVSNMSKEEINQTIEKLIYSNDIKNDELKEYEYSCAEPAAGIQYLLWLCPNCGKSDTIKGVGDEIICTACGDARKLSGHLKIKPEFDTIEDLKDWSDWQKKEIKKKINEKDDFLTKSKNIKIGKRFGKKLVYEDDGDFFLYKDSAVFRSNRKTSERVFPIKKIKYYVDNFNRSFEFSFESDRIALNLMGQNSYKWQCFLKELQS